jgi:hypothetical protein
MEWHRHPDLIAQDAANHLRHHPDDHEGPSVDRRRGSNDVLVAAEPPLPNGVRQHHDVVFADLLFGEEAAPQQRPHAERAEEVRSHTWRRDAFRIIAAVPAQHGDSKCVARRERRDRFRLRAVVKEIRP